MIPYGYRMLKRNGFDDRYGHGMWLDKWQETKHNFLKYFNIAVAVDISPIYHIIDSAKLKISNIFPPWNSFWIEILHKTSNTGILVISRVIKEGFDFGNISDYANEDSFIGGWQFTTMGITFNKRKSPFITDIFEFYVSKEGRLLAENNSVLGKGIQAYGLYKSMLKEKDYTPKELEDSHLSWCNKRVNIITNFISFMQCRNIKAKPTHYPDYKPRKHRRHKIYKYYELVVVKPTIQNINEPHGEGVKGKALHTVRGHISHYTVDKPLFGINGLCGDFYVPQHARGKIKYGKVEKTYKTRHL